MRRQKMRMISIWLIMVLVLTLIPELPVKANTICTDDSGYWDFGVDANGNATLGRFNKNVNDFDGIIPEYVVCDGKQYKVVGLGEKLFYALNVTSVVIPSSVQVIGNCAFQNTGLTSVTFAPGSQLHTIGDEAFNVSSGLTTITIPASVKNIGKSAFSGTNITSVNFEAGSQLLSIGNSAFADLAITSLTLPSGLQTIGNYAFCDTAIKSLMIPASVKTIGEYAFYQSELLTSVTFAQGSQLESIGQVAFNGCAFESITIPASVKTLDNRVFYYCKSLTSVHFEEGSQLTTIGDSCFYYCPALTSVEIPASVKTIGAEVFNSCFGLTSVVIPKDSQLESIGDSAFCSTKITEIYLPSTLTSIGTSAFNGTKVDKVEIPANVTTLGEDSFLYCHDLEEIYYPADLEDEVTAAVGSFDGLKGAYTVSDTTPPTISFTYSGNVGTEITVPETVAGMEVTEVQVGNMPALPAVLKPDCKAKALSDLADMLPEGYAFVKPETKLIPGENISCEVSYGNYTFTVTVKVADHQSTELMDVKAATCVTEGYSGDTYCKDCDTVITKGKIIAATGHQHTELINVKVATCVTEGYTGDTYCKDCNSVIENGSAIAMLPHTWDEGVVTKEATYTETGVKTYTCTGCGATFTEEILVVPTPAKGTTFTDSKSNGIYKITKSDLAKGTVQYVKPKSKNKKTVVIPTTVTLDGITYKVTSIAKNAFKNNQKLTKITIGNNVKTIGDNAFCGCKKLKTVKLGKNVTTIGAKAFYNCGKLTSITIPSKVSKIGKQAFYKCKNLKKITIKTSKLTKKRVGSKAFGKIYSKATIKVPKKKLKTYKSLLKLRGVSKKAIFKKL